MKYWLLKSEPDCFSIDDLAKAKQQTTLWDGVSDPAWMMVDICLTKPFAKPLALEQLRAIPALKEMELLRRGSRLSVQPVTKPQFEAIIKLAK